MLKQFSIRTKTLTVLLLMSVISAGASSYIGYSSAQKSLQDQSFSSLTAVRELKASQIENYFENISQQILSYSEDKMIVDAMRLFSDAVKGVSDDSQENPGCREILRQYYQQEFLPRLDANAEQGSTVTQFFPAEKSTIELQCEYIAENRFQTGSKHLLDKGNSLQGYDQVHSIYHPLIRNFADRFGYYDIFLVDAESGHVVYSVFKEVDFGTSLSTGPYRETNLGVAFSSARDASSPTFSKLVDFEPYPPSYNSWASFIAAPIFDGQEKLGVLVFQLPVDRINDIMTSNQAWNDVGLGFTGETYIVGEDLKMRNQSRFYIENPDEYLQLLRSTGVPESDIRKIDNLGSTIGLQHVDTYGTRAAARGETDTAIFEDYRDVAVLSAYSPLTIGDVRWIIMSEIDASEAFRSVTDLRNGIAFGFFILIALVVLVGYGFSKTLTLPIETLSQKANEIAGGNLDVEVDINRQDELGHLARSFDVMKMSLRDQLEKQEKAIEALSVPLIPLQDDILAMPLIGHLDAKRMAQLQSTLVEGIYHSGARAVILDLTGIPEISPSEVKLLAQAARAVRLLGAHVVLTGMKPNVAETLSENDIALLDIQTERTLHRGLAAVQRIIQNQKSESE